MRARTKAEARVLLVEEEQRAERQRRGLEPVTRNPERWTLGELRRWWLEAHSQHLAAQRRVLPGEFLPVANLPASITGKEIALVSPEM